MKVRVRNIKGTSDENPPKGFESWIAYWEFKMKREIPNKCKCPGCNKFCDKKDIEGCHVERISYNMFIEGRYIMPLCKQCNHRSDTFDINPTLLVDVPDIM